MTPPASTARKRLETLRAQFTRPDISPADKAGFVAHRPLQISRAWPTFRLPRHALLELSEAPRAFRGRRDLVIRRGDPTDARALCTLNGSTVREVLTRFERGDLVFIGELDGRLLCHAWFHPGPAPFPDDEAPWALEAGTFWSFDREADPEVAGSGVFPQVYQTGLRTLFANHGARRVWSAVCPAHAEAMRLHERLGFRRIGTITSFVVARWSLVRWSGRGMTAHWFARRGVGPVVALPVRD